MRSSTILMLISPLVLFACANDATVAARFPPVVPVFDGIGSELACANADREFAFDVNADGTPEHVCEWFCAETGDPRGPGHSHVYASDTPAPWTGGGDPPATSSECATSCYWSEHALAEPCSGDSEC